MAPPGKQVVSVSIDEMHGKLVGPSEGHGAERAAVGGAVGAVETLPQGLGCHAVNLDKQ